MTQPRPPLILTVLIVAVTAVACGGASRSADPWTIGGPARPMPPDLERVEGRRGPGGGTILEPSSVPIQDGVAYEYSLGHCGLLSPVDVDGSFWDAVDGRAPGGGPLDLDADAEMINGTPGVIAIRGDEARFRTESGAVVRFERHAGDKEFPGCD